MEKYNLFKGTGVICTIRKHSSAKKITLSVRDGGRVTVTIPKRVSYKTGKKFANKHRTWIKQKLRQAKRITRKSILEKGTIRDYKKNKARARELVESKIEKFNKRYNFHFKRISIRNQRTRWGSCSTNKNLNFNYRIIFLKEKHVNYLVVHELCHLGQMNHSRQFWALVAKEIPDYKQLAKEVRAL